MQKEENFCRSGVAANLYFRKQIPPNLRQDNNVKGNYSLFWFDAQIILDFFLP